MENQLIFDLTMMTAKILVIVLCTLGVAPFIVWFERRGAAWMQRRVGPNRVGPFGLLQSLADVLKFAFKESFAPRDANQLYYFLAPVISLIAPMCALAVIPFGGKAIINGQEVWLQVANMNTGVIFILAFAGLEVYPIILGGWASRNKYSVLGALRGSSQIVSYEISMGLSLLSMLVVFGTFDPHEMVAFQNHELWGWVPKWGFLLNPFGALVFWIATFAETNRLPFDLPEGESELVAGYHVEYAGMRFAAFFMSEYVAMIMACSLLVTVYFGGYAMFPGMEVLHGLVGGKLGFGEVGLQNLRAFMEFASFFVKVSFFMFVMVWIRWTLPRFRFDQLMDLGWKILFPLSLINLVLVTVAVYYFNS